jgi:hypothetical protein
MHSTPTILAVVFMVFAIIYSPSEVPTDRLVRILDSTCLVAPEL